MTPERLAEIQYHNNESVPYVPVLKVAPGTNEWMAEADHDRRELLAEVDRLQTQVADAWDEGFDSAAGWKGASLTVVVKHDDNPYRAVLASGDES